VEGYGVLSNRETGLGRSDIQMAPGSPDLPYIALEFKIASERGLLEAKCEEAIAQARSREYGEEAAAMGYQSLLRYGVAFWKKHALARLA
jgi:hypothetical protein